MKKLETRLKSYEEGRGFMPMFLETTEINELIRYSLPIALNLLPRDRLVFTDATVEYGDIKGVVGLYHRDYKKVEIFSSRKRIVTLSGRDLVVLEALREAENETPPTF